MARKFDEYTDDAINGIYDAKEKQRLGELENAYQDSVASAERSRAKIGGVYQQKQNELALSYERARKNTNEQLAANGMNTGTGSQAALAQRSAYQRDSGALHAGEAAAMSEAEQNLRDLEAKYRRDVNAAIADNDYNRANALYQAYLNDLDRQIKSAAVQANYGDFSGYAELYGEDKAAGMKNVWNATNPDLAYRSGAIDGEEYYRMMGMYPAGYVPEGFAGGGGGSIYDNWSSDVLAKQKMINQNAALLGIKPIKTDGVMGPETAKALAAQNAYYSSRNI